MNKQRKLLELENPVARRTFFKNMTGIAGVALVGGSLGTLKAAAITDTDILNFALNLEYLEAEFYTVATTGKTIDQFGIGITGTGMQGVTFGISSPVNFGTDRLAAAVAAEITFDEQQHVKLLRSVLGTAAIAKPAINLSALGNPFGSVQAFLTLARAFEDVGVSAYGFAAPLITDKTILAAAARIALTEALHAGNVRLQVAERNISVSPVDSADIVPPPAGSKYFAVDDNALAIVRSPNHVLAIVFGNRTAGTSSGGFFPHGVNGTINTV